MRVLHLFNEIKFSGAEIMYASAAGLFQKDGVEMYAFSTGLELGDFVGEFERNRIKVFHHPIKKGIDLSFSLVKSYINFYHFLIDEKIDILHIHRSDLYTAAFVARLAGVKTIKTMHSVFKNPKRTLFFARAKRFIARYLFKVKFQTIGESVYENELIYYRNPSIRINNWYNKSLFFPAQDEKERRLQRERLGLNPNAFVLISVGGCTNNKNHSDIIRALALLAQESEYYYLHLGTGKVEKEERELADELGVSDRIRFVGNKKNVRDYLIASDVYVMSSYFEGLSISSLEAMACGLPSVLYNSVGLKDLIIDDDNGFLIDRDYKLIAAKVKYLRDNPAIAKKMGENGVKLANSEYSISKGVSDLMDLYAL